MLLFFAYSLHYFLWEIHYDHIIITNLNVFVAAALTDGVRHL